MFTIQRSVPETKGAQQIGARLFQTYCVQCHGTDMRDSKGFPNLVDNDWLYPGTPDGIKTSILEGRNGMMPAFADVLKADQITNTAQYVLALSGRSTATTARRAVKQHSNSFARRVMALKARAWSHWARLT